MARDPLTFGSQLKCWLNFDSLGAYADGASVSSWPYANNGAKAATAVAGANNIVRRVGGGGVTIPTAMHGWELADPLDLTGGFSVIAMVSSLTSPSLTVYDTIEVVDGDATPGSLEIDGSPFTTHYDIRSAAGSIYHGLQPPFDTFIEGEANQYLAGWSYTNNSFAGVLDGGLDIQGMWLPKPVTGTIGEVLRRVGGGGMTPLIKQFAIFQPALDIMDLYDVLGYFGLLTTVALSLVPSSITATSSVSGDLERIVTAPANLSFEVSGATSGLAFAWSYSATATFEECADFSATPWDSFERGWQNDAALFALTQGTTAPPQLATLSASSKSAENFEELWSNNHLSQFSLTTAVPMELSLLWTGETPQHEAFESGWHNGPAGDPDGVFLTSLPSDSVSHGLEWFDFGWGAYITELLPGNLERPAWANGELQESFNYVAPRALAVIDATSDTVYAPELVPVNGLLVLFETTNIELPEGIESGEVYHVRDVSGSTFALAEFNGGPPIDIVSAGPTTRPTYVLGAPTWGWNTVMASFPFRRSGQSIGEFAGYGFSAAIWTGFVSTNAPATFGAAGLANFNADGVAISYSRSFTAAASSTFAATLGVSTSRFIANGVSAFTAHGGIPFASGNQASFAPTTNCAQFTALGQATSTFSG